jgi:hypothetical protein
VLERERGIGLEEEEEEERRRGLDHWRERIGVVVHLGSYA